MALTNTDKNWIRGVMEEQEQKFEAKIVEVKSDFYEKIDPILKEVVTAREDRTIVENRIEKLEEIHQEGSHSLNP